MKTAVVGLGLIGGSVARRLRGFRGTKIAACDTDTETLALAKTDGVIDEGSTHADIISDADFIILCMYPQLNIDFVRENLCRIKSGAVICDVSGIKGYITKEIAKFLPHNIDFVGAHPMAGREVSGYTSSTDTLFDNASFIITPTESNRPESIALVREFASYIGCRHVVTTSPEEHDEMIAYTSQLMHVVAAALCDNPMLERSACFSAGSLRDCTRVAVLNEKMWSELFCENSTALCKRIDEMQQSLEKIKTAVAAEDREELEKIMRRVTERKKKYLMEQSK